MSSYSVEDKVYDSNRKYPVVIDQDTQEVLVIFGTSNQPLNQVLANIVSSFMNDKCFNSNDVHYKLKRDDSLKYVVNRLHEEYFVEYGYCDDGSLHIFSLTGEC